MASLNFKGKSAVWNHHLSVPYHTLEKDGKKSLKGNDNTDNLIIEGDNLLALKALLPKYQDSIKCIYIDPPYNTGNEGWVYNDNVNSPLIKDWLGKVVGKDDLTRHDKWLCMMTPRLKLLRDLLSDDGAIFISIDNNEINHLIDLLNEIFGESNFVGTFVWRKKEGGGQTDDYFVTEHEYVVVYRKTDAFKWLDEEIPQGDSAFNKQDKNGKYKAVKLAKWGTAAKRTDRPSMYFALEAPNGKKVYPIAPDGSEGRWRVGQRRLESLIESNLVEWIERNKKWIPYEKIYFENGDIKVIKERSIIFDLAYTGDGTEELTEMFGVKDFFENPKPSQLIKYLISYVTDKDSIVLDSYAGSGTTAHAVMNLNKEDGGHRRFILIQLPERVKENTPPYKAGFHWIHEITLERAKRVIEKLKNKIGFTYYNLGSAIDADSILAGKLPKYDEFAKYVFYLATGKNHPDEKKIKEKEYFVGKSANESIYLLYEQDMEKLKTLAITLDWAQDIHSKDKGKKIVYAPACYLDEESLDRFNIKFVSIPYNLFERPQ
jgi:adenine-specific DNA-methyltransferase